MLAFSRQPFFIAGKNRNAHGRIVDQKNSAAHQYGTYVDASGRHQDNKLRQSGGKYGTVLITVPGALPGVMWFTEKIQQEITRQERGKMKKIAWAAATALTVGLLTSAGPSAAMASPTDNEVHNTSTIAVGAVEVYRGPACIYRQGCYDALIPAGQYSGWRHTGAIFFGDNYCLRVRPWQPGGGLGPVQISPEGPGWAVLPDAPPGFDVRARPIGSADCDRSAQTSSDAGYFVQAKQ
ncbi:hypothetical protein [Nonomuraea guangzhouensis]|uniref:Uncharacterized protein n=1 Tax=Nonomuraea guangzhouensis TaxID=1291555 RepID=A0ABW4GV04_9ACTN|nr:hypothetical protein [Nonomuraea guangzhouensis]